MSNARTAYITAFAVAIVTAVATYWLQRYRMLELEECYIFLYDSHYIADTAMRPGGVALLLASLLTQLMTSPWTGPLLVAPVYGLLALSQCRIAARLGGASYIQALCIATTVCLFLCLENNSYKFQGHTAMLIAMLLLWLYTARAGSMSTRARLCFGAVISLLAYMSAGSSGLLTAFGAMVYDIKSRSRHHYISIAYTAIVAVTAYICFRAQLVPTLKRALTPTMYYEWDTTAYMMLYTWAAAAVLIIAAATVPSGVGGKRSRATIVTVVLVALQIGIGARMYTLVHTPTVMRTMQQRYYAKQGDWDAILAIDYDDAPTPFTSYRFLALAHKGRLVDELPSTRPFIDYFMKNRTLVKKEDLEVLSDIYYACDYMAAARHFAFDTNIVTPGAFNPYETLKLAEINILTGDYAVADKYLAQLEKTLNYRGRAADLRRFMHNDKAVDNDPVLGPRRRAIPRDDAYLSPKGTLRDLRQIIADNPNQSVARQFLETFIILTNYKE